MTVDPSMVSSLFTVNSSLYRLKSHPYLDIISSTMTPLYVRLSSAFPPFCPSYTGCADVTLNIEQQKVEKAEFSVSTKKTQILFNYFRLDIWGPFPRVNALFYP